MNKIIQNIVEKHLKITESIIADERILSSLNEQADLCIETLKSGNKILLCGNGGSAADAQHIAAELSGKFYLDRKPLYAEALHVNSSYMTAVSNDYGFVHAYERLIQAKGQPGDLLFGLSTSGNSENVVLAFEAAKSQNIKTIGWTGQDGGKLKDHSSYLIQVPSDDTARIQEMHILFGHIVCELVEKALFPNR